MKINIILQKNEYKWVLCERIFDNYMSVYIKKSGNVDVSIAPPPGSILAYLGNSDPDGWVIANGGSRTNDGRYQSLLNMNIGTLSNNLYVPPDYRGAFLRSTGNNGIYSGPGLGQPQLHATEKHRHTVNDLTHTHSFYNFYDNGDNGGSTEVRFGWNDGTTEFTVNDASVDTSKTTSGINIFSNYTGITIKDSSGSAVNTNETRPYNYGVNWIIKL